MKQAYFTPIYAPAIDLEATKPKADFRNALTRVGFQGNQGSFSHVAGNKFFDNYDLQQGGRRTHLVQFDRFPDAINAFNTQKIDELFLPIHNNTSGRVTDMHGLLNGINGWIAHEYYLHVIQCLLVQKGVRYENIKEVCSQEPAVKQCLENIKSGKFHVTYSHDTAAAAEFVRKSKRRDLAAIASENAGQIHGLENLGPFCDSMNNYTRFLHFVHPSQITRVKHASDEKCSTTFFLSGDLFPKHGRSPFDVFSGNGVKITRNEGVHPDFDSRETIIDVDGHNKSPDVAACFNELEAIGYKSRILGCYKTVLRPILG